MKKNPLYAAALVLFVSTTSQGRAQEAKPTKDETIAFINRTLNDCKGRKLPHALGTLESATFDGNTLEYQAVTTYEREGRETAFTTTNILYENLRWEQLDTKRLEYYKFENSPCSCFSVAFNSNIKVSTSHVRSWDERENDKTEYRLNAFFYVPEDKKESMSKAILHLHEIDSEQNKDPFSN